MLASRIPGNYSRGRNPSAGAGAVRYDTTQSLTPTQQAQALQNLGLQEPSGGRLTLTSGTPVLLSSVTGVGTVYYALDRHDKVPVYDGTSWRLVTITELSMALDSNAGHTGYHQSGKNFDWFYAYVSGTLYFGTGPAWTNNTTRSAGLARLNGIPTNSGSMTLRHGTAVGNTVTVPANQATHLGTMYATADGQTSFTFGSAASGGGAGLFGLWNRYNRRPFTSDVVDNGASYTYSSGTPRQARASAGNQHSFIFGDQDEPVSAGVIGTASVVGAVNANCRFGVALDTTSSFPYATGDIYNNGTVALRQNATSALDFPAGIGFHVVSLNESSDGTNSNTFNPNTTNTLSVTVWM